MLVIDNFLQVAAQIESERGVSRETLIEAIEQALVAACRRKFPEEANLDGRIDPVSGEAGIWHIQNVVDEIEDEDNDILLADAAKIDSSATVGETIEEEVTPEDFGRIAAQAARQVIVQRIREAEKNSIYDEFIEKEGQIINGTVQRVENRNYLINLGRVESLMMPHDQIRNEELREGDRVKVFLSAVEQSPKGPLLRISRGHPDFLRRLLELEVPEIADGIIDILSVSREPGVRAKVAVKSNNPAIGAVGTCVGHMGGRIQAIIKELCGEKIDVLEWSENPAEFIANSLKPAKIAQVVILDTEEKHAVVVVPNDQLSLAIGKAGVNVRLAVKLVGWKLDILSEDEYAERSDEFVPVDHMSIVEKIQAEKAQNDDTPEAPVPTPLSSKLLAGNGETEEMKVSELAKMLGLKTAELMEKAANFGVEIKSNRSKLTPEQVDIIKEKLI